MTKVLLQCGLSPGDIVMLTAAVRDLHLCYPGRFQTDVRTRCEELWENNPYLAPLSDRDSGVKRLACSYPLINYSNRQPYHCLHGFIDFLNHELGLQIVPTAFKGDIHLSEQERAWYSQVHELTGEDTPFWIVAAGGKYDVTIKWWEQQRYQQVVDHFHGRIQFAQVGSVGHHHPKLDGVIDLRGKTSLRELVRLVYHAQGILCPITSLMHLAAAVPLKHKNQAHRPCVVIAGGREPAHWEAYPGHQFIHTIGALSCCAAGGCWKDRVKRLRDGDKRDRAGSLCDKLSGDLPRCMDMITPEEVIKRIELYYEGGQLRYLNRNQQAQAALGVNATKRNSFDQEPLNLHEAGLACDSAVAELPDYPNRFEGRGIVICAGGVQYFTNAWVCINRLRRAGCTLAIELWHFGAEELDGYMATLIEALDVRCVDARSVKKSHHANIRSGWPLKAYALVHSRFKEVFLLDADNVAVANPEFLFHTNEFKRSGAIFWPDYDHPKTPKKAAIWRSCGLRISAEPEFESGQVLVDKQKCWRALNLALWFNENSRFYYQYVYGDKETFHLAFRKVKKRYAMIPKGIHRLEGTMCQHDFSGRRIFQHRNTAKWELFGPNKRIKGFRFEGECMQHLEALRRLWNGTIEKGSVGCAATNPPRGRNRTVDRVSSDLPMRA